MEVKLINLPVGCHFQLNGTKYIKTSDSRSPLVFNAIKYDGTKWRIHFGNMVKPLNTPKQY